MFGRSENIERPLRNPPTSTSKNKRDRVIPTSNLGEEGERREREGRKERVGGG